MGIKYTKNTEYQSSLSRYGILRQIVSEEYTVGPVAEKTNYLETYNKIQIPVSDTDIFYTVKVQEENRLDVISNSFYGTPLLWWAIAEASGIQDPFFVPAGTVVRVPSLSTLRLPGNKILSQ